MVNVFVDSSIFIEHLKGLNTSLVIELSEDRYNCFINGVVYSEFMYHFLGVASNKSPLSVYKSKQIFHVLQKYEPFRFISSMNILNIDFAVIKLSYDLMKKYNLLPNDSIIIACCRHYRIPTLISYDSGFESVCVSEKIKLINTVDMLNQI